MKKQLQKKLSTFIVITMLFSASANAQIVYTDLIPNKVLSCSFNNPCSPDYSLDLNNDGMSDFVLSSRKRFVGCGACASTVYVMANGDSAVIIPTAVSWISDQVGGYPINTVIDSSLGWTNAIHTLATKRAACESCSPSPGNHLVQSPSSGPWANVSGKFVALKIQVGTNFYYGWVRLSLTIASNTVSLTILDYAYNSISGQPILAGQATTTGISSLSLGEESGVTLFPNPANNHLTIDLGTYNKEVQATITDITGKVIYKTAAFSTQNIEVNTEDFPTGIYVVQILSTDFIATKKLVIEK